MDEKFIDRLNELRVKFEFSKEAPKHIYVLKLDKAIEHNKKALKSRTFPNGLDYPELFDIPKGFVYVGVTGLSVEYRYKVHCGKGKKASKVAKLGFLSNYSSFEKCGKELTDSFGFYKVGWKENKPEKIESWVAWSLYKQGYWVWGSHFHLSSNFLGTKPFH